MGKNVGLLTLLMAVFIMLAACGSTNAETDKSGYTNKEETEENTASEPETNERLVSTTVAITEIMDQLDLDLVGIPTSYKELPARYDGLKDVGIASEPDLEIIRSLGATEVLSVTTIQNEYNIKPIFDNAGVPVHFLDLESVEGMLDSITELGEKYDRREQAGNLVGNVKQHIAEKEALAKKKESPKVLILVGIPGSYRVATEHSYIGDLVKRMGGTNAIQDADTEFVQANTENLLQSDPDVILRAAHGMPDAVKEMFDKEFQENDIWKHFKAVKNDRVFDLEERLFGMTADLNVVEALDELESMLYPEGE